ncbi:hypothetical protein [Edaphobacter aggregans]|uniref:hypothetical protein n=1 Tax=Edaphobacter aggregans TaxID=570835 RepID=UPI00054E89C4|nr:hypothetical protein [Edaphobacter aggregans]
MLTTNGRSQLLIALASTLILPFGLTGCTRTPAQASAPSPSLDQEQRQALEAARQQLDLIPPPSKTRYMAVRSLTSWENPYLTVQGGMVTLHVLLADANTSQLGQGGLLRPIGARRRNLDVRLSDLPTALNAIPSGAWPYGRVVAVEEAHETPVSARAQVRRNMESVIKTLGDLGVVVYEWNDSGRGL